MLGSIFVLASTHIVKVLRIMRTFSYYFKLLLPLLFASCCKKEHQLLLAKSEVAMAQKDQSMPEIQGADMFEFPKLTGEYGVGTTARYVVDQKRKEPFNLDAQRELMIYLWYPAQLENKNPLIAYRADEMEAQKYLCAKRGILSKI